LGKTNFGDEPPVFFAYVRLIISLKDRRAPKPYGRNRFAQTQRPVLPRCGQTALLNKGNVQEEINCTFKQSEVNQSNYLL
jgi:hypothetical protein